MEMWVTPPPPTNILCRKVDYMNIDLIAKAAHEVNKVYCESLGDTSQTHWDDAPEWQKDSARNGVKFHLNNPDTTPEQGHENWIAQKEREGWIYGPVKDVVKKEHPCMRPYNRLPVEQRNKDYIFKNVISIFRHVMNQSLQS